MVFRRFRTACTLRVILLSLSFLASAYLVLESTMYATATILGVLAVLQVVGLISFVERSNRDLERFLRSIEYSDFSQTFVTGMKGRSFDELSRAFTDVMTRFQEIRREREESYRYLQAVVQHVGMGIIAFGAEGSVDLVNTSAKRMLGLAKLRRIDELEAKHPALHHALRHLEPGQRELLKVVVDDELLQISVYVTDLRLRNRRITLAGFQNISSELDEKEMEAWQKLVRVLTHEIKNSLTPIASLASTVEDLVATGSHGDAEADSERGKDIREALQTIQKRARGLEQFVDAYKNLTHIPKPKYQNCRVTDLLARVEKLVHIQLREAEIAFTTSVRPESLEIMADPQLVEQVLINLLLNSVHAVAGRKGARISVIALYDERSRPVIRVIDNGPGILEEVLPKVFVPFFTTRKGGSGIGLSLSRQIMRLHRGDLTAQSRPDEETAFTMRF